MVRVSIIGVVACTLAGMLLETEAAQGELTGAVRQEFVDIDIKYCLKSLEVAIVRYMDKHPQRDQPVQRNAVDKYCRCEATCLANSFSKGDIDSKRAFHYKNPHGQYEGIKIPERRACFSACVKGMFGPNWNIEILP
jgi:hypothetical protein